MDKLKPCPWCGKSPVKFRVSVHESGRTRFECNSRTCPVRPRAAYRKTESAAASSWNDRPGEQAAIRDNEHVAEAVGLLESIVEDDGDSFGYEFVSKLVETALASLRKARGE